MVDTRDLKSLGSNPVPVQVRSSAIFKMSQSNHELNQKKKKPRNLNFKFYSFINKIENRRKKKNSDLIPFENAFEYISYTNYLNNVANINLILESQILIIRNKTRRGKVLTQSELKTLNLLQKAIKDNAKLLSSAHESFLLAKQELENAVLEYKSQFPLLDYNNKLFDDFIDWFNERESRGKFKS